MAHTQKQLEIMDYMQRFDLSETTIAKWLGMKPNKLAYQLNNAIELKDVYYKEIKKQLINRKYLSDQNECQRLFDLTSGFLQSLTTQFSLFSSEVSRTIKNHAIELHERPRLRTKYDDLKEQVDRFDEEMKKLGI